MLKNVIISSIIASVLIIGASQPVSALTAADVQAQIQALLAKVAELTAQINVLRGQGTEASTPAAPTLQRICTRSIGAFEDGDEGDDVRAFQEFLQSEGFLAVSPTGYFGQITKEALRRWQAAQGFESAGVVGPKTLARIRERCGLVTDVRFSASPTRGDAPLTVTFSHMVGGFRPASISYSLDFGDGTSERATECSAPADACVSPGKNTHTYGTPGTYRATLRKTTDPCYGQPACRAAIHQEVIGTLQIVVGGVGSVCTKEYMPVCGGKSVVCITTPCNPIPTTYANRCMMVNDGAGFLYEGACRALINPADDPQCKQWFDGCNTCSRNAPGATAACTLRYCPTQQAAYCVAYFDTTNRPPVVSGISGPTTLAVNQSGTWTVTASDPEKGSLSYSINWGEAIGYAESAATPASQSYEQKTTFSHSYSSLGTYTITVFVTDKQGGSSQASVTVKVGGDITCAAVYEPVCGRPGGCANTCLPGQVCPAICQLKEPQTYSNRCTLNYSGAQYLHEGLCTPTSGNW